jgi:hypothetical protein
MNNKIYEIRNTELSPKDAALLWRFTAAYRPHDPIQNWRELRDSGLDAIDEESVMDVILDQHEEAKFTPTSDDL